MRPPQAYFQTRHEGSSSALADGYTGAATHQQPPSPAEINARELMYTARCVCVCGGGGRGLCRGQRRGAGGLLRPAHAGPVPQACAGAWRVHGVYAHPCLPAHTTMACALSHVI